VGDDASGQRLREDLTARGVDVSGLTAPHTEWSTPTYAKPIRAGKELERLDFGTRQTLEEGHLTQYASALAAAIRNCGGVVLNQQIDPGALPPSMAQRLGALAAERSEVRFLADTRRVLGELAGIPHQRNVASLGVDLSPSALEARALEAAGGGVLFVTMGSRGILVADAGRAQRVEAVPVEGPFDPVGAGDTAVAALTAATATGATPLAAARLATVAAAVTVKKLGQTGTATAQEVRELARGME
jgi:sugar/nucleoside kinase (ribokinase family)